MASDSWNKIESELEQVAVENHIVTTPKKNSYNHDQGNDDQRTSKNGDHDLSCSSNSFLSSSRNINNHSDYSFPHNGNGKEDPIVDSSDLETDKNVDVSMTSVEESEPHNDDNASAHRQVELCETVNSVKSPVKNSEHSPSVIINMEDDNDSEMIPVDCEKPSSPIHSPRSETKFPDRIQNQEEEEFLEEEEEERTMKKGARHPESKASSSKSNVKLAPIFANVKASALKSRSKEPGSEGQIEDDDFIPKNQTRLSSDKPKRNHEFDAKIKSINEANLIEFQRLRRFQPDDKIFPQVRVSDRHTICVRLENDFRPGDPLEPYPTKFVPKWDKLYVPLPCHDNNVRTVKRRVYNDESENSDDERKPNIVVVKVSIWEKTCSALTEKPFTCCEDIARAMKKYNRFDGDLNILEYTLDKLMTSDEVSRFFETVLPGMINLCLDLPNVVTCPLPLLLRFHNYSITLSQKQIACLLANAFFSTLPEQLEDEDDFPSINFVTLLSSDEQIPSKANKLRCLLHYFDRVITEMPRGIVTFTRRFLSQSSMPDWSNSNKKITKLITLNEGSIETEGERFSQIDFANKYIGGGVLGSGCVQEEILFVIYPELLISRLFTSRLVAGESLFVTGCERFSRYKGYARSFQYDGDFIDSTPWDHSARKCTQIVAIDALKIRKTEETWQFHPKQLTREINKAYVGFSAPVLYSNKFVAVATGKWGCGAFGGDAHLKTIIQLIAASEAGRDVIFFTFGDSTLQVELEEIYSALKDKTIREVWSLLVQYNRLYCTQSNKKRSLNLHEFVAEFARAADLSNAFDDDDDDMDFEFTTLKPENNKNSEVDKSSCSKKGNDDERMEGAQTKSQWIAPKKSHDLTEDEISALVNDEEGLEDGEKTGRSATNTKGPSRNDKSNVIKLLESTTEETSNANATNTASFSSEKEDNKKHNIPFLKKGNGNPLSSPKRCNPLSSNTSSINDPSSSSSSPSTSDIPKQKRQMTLKDFYTS